MNDAEFGSDGASMREALRALRALLPASPAVATGEVERLLRYEAILDAMTPEQLRAPARIDAPQQREIAARARVEPAEVLDLCRCFAALPFQTPETTGRGRLPTPSIC